MKPDFFLFVALGINYKHHFLRGKTHVAFSPLQGAPRPTFVTWLAQNQLCFQRCQTPHQMLSPALPSVAKTHKCSPLFKDIFHHRIVHHWRIGRPAAFVIRKSLKRNKDGARYLWAGHLCMRRVRIMWHYVNKKANLVFFKRCLAFVYT